MKKKMVTLAACELLVCMGLLLASCRQEEPPASTTTEPTETIITGWHEGVYYLEDGTVASGWQTIDGVLHYLNHDGTPASGWVDIDGALCYFTPEGTPASGWMDIDGSRYYLNANGAATTGWLVLDGQQYYFQADGVMYVGWLDNGLQSCYFREDGTMATGAVEIEGDIQYFTDSGDYIPLVNPWRYVPDYYAANLLPLYDGQYVEVHCYSALMEMLDACAAAGFKPYVCSAYRTQSAQEYLFERKVSYYLDEGYEDEEARELAATVVAVPGTSEHQLGLAVDIIDEDFPYLTDEQADTATQQWLMEHCWEYGFILRYPKDKTDVTGIIWEPWHYRYVGVELALQIRDSGLTLEEYLGFTHE